MALILLPLDLDVWPAARRQTRPAPADSRPRPTRRKSELRRCQARALRAKEML